MERKKVLELDKICRVCIAERKDMRPLFSEKIAEMLMECATVNIENTEGWPDKICVQCVHAVSRCHAFKKQVERSDKELREYIKSLTVRVVIEETNDMKLDASPQKMLSQKPPKLQLIQPQTQFQLQTQQNQLQLQQQQIILQPQQQQQQQPQQQHQHQPQSQQLQQVQQLQLQQQQQQQPSKRKAVSTSRKSQRQSKKSHLLPQQVQQQQHQQQQTLEHVSLQTMVQNVTPPRTQAQPATQHLQTTQTSLQQQQPQPQQLISTAALPQQIVLPNGQIITTAQIVTHAGPPQIAQIISTPNGSTVQANPSSNAVAAQPQFTPQIIQTSNGQTLQLIQQPNGQQTLQLVHVMPQRTIATTANGTSVMVTTSEDGTTTIVDDETLITPDEHNLIDDEADMEEDDEQEQICETIVVEDDQITHQQLLAGHHTIVDEDNLSQGEAQELEYLEDVTVTTSNVGHSHHQQHHHTQHYQQLSDCDGDASQQQHIQLHDDDDIIEEIHMDEEEMLEDDGADVMHVMEGDGSEFISDEDGSQQHLVGENGDPLQYTVLEAATDDEELVESDVKEVLQAACGSEMQNVVDLNQTVSSVASGCGGGGGGVGSGSGASVGSQTPTPKRQRKSNAKAVANSRQLVATASSIATSGASDDLDFDPKFIAEIISQQTTVLGSGRHVCNLCRHEFKQFKALHNHMHQHSNWIRANCKKQPQCEICLKSFKGPGMLKMHMKTHQSAARTPTCNICNKSFKSKAILYRHRQTHQLRSYACAVDNCRKTFSMPQTLRTHSDNKHPNAKQPKFKCGECSLHFDDVDMLHTHVQTGVHCDTLTMENGDGGGNNGADGSGGGSIDGSGCMDGNMAGNTIIVVTQG
uniref:basic-leucine zipper transcription factor A n=1 Tax=Bactrocera dorsalis TaxID=27457 RepID=A0A034VY30_BACDO